MTPLARRLTAIGVALPLLVFLQCLGIWIPGVDILLVLLFGWIAFIYRNVSQLRVRWDMAISALVYSIVFVVGSHAFARWLRREMRPTQPPWRWRWTLAGFGIVILMFTAGVATVGVVHQSVWLARSPRGIYQLGGLRANENRCADNFRLIGLALQQYAQGNGGRYPDDLRPLLLSQDYGLTPWNFICLLSDDMPARGNTPEETADALLTPSHCSYLYLGKGLTAPTTAEQVIAFEPAKNHRDYDATVLYGDGRIETIRKKEAVELLKRLGFELVKIENERKN